MDYDETSYVEGLIKPYNQLKLLEFKQKNEMNETCAECVGILSGLALYFDELDVIKYNQTKHYDNFIVEFNLKFTLFI